MTAALARLRLPPLAMRLTAAAATPLTLYAVALAVGLVASGLVGWPTNEGSAYYVAVARNLATGRGLITDSFWSYATPPLVLPRPAFELWQPMASFVAALPMALLRPTFGAAQLGAALLGALVAPLTWAITRDAARAVDVPRVRVETLAVGGALVASVGAPLVLAVTVPDSTLPFMVFGTAACWLAPRAWSTPGRPYAALSLGAILGLAYLSRHEAMYVGAAILLAGVGASRARARTESVWRSAARWWWLAPAIVGGLVVVSPWLLRNVAVFATPLPGQALDNALLTSNEQIFAYASRPTLAGFLGQGPTTIIGNIIAAGGHNLVEVVVVMAMPVGAAGALAAAFLVVRQRGLSASSLWPLLASGALTFAVATLIFPVASLWGTFAHAAGPLLVGLTVAAVIGGDAVVDYVGRRRGWQRANAWLAPLALGLVAATLCGLQLLLLGRSADDLADRYDAIAAVVAEQPEAGLANRPVISDHPMWLADATGLPALALPAEPPDVVLRLARDFGASLVVVAEGRGDYPAAFRSPAAAHCFVERTSAELPPGSAVFAINPECAP